MYYDLKSLYTAYTCSGTDAVSFMNGQ
ncbi:MAG: hypothetical protein RLZZ502_271, partial [Pseudomonadota bacterium]